jgi:hypothetical protein
MLLMVLLLLSHPVCSLLTIKPRTWTPLSSISYKSRIYGTPNDAQTTSKLFLESEDLKSDTLKQPEIGLNTYITVFGILPIFSFFVFDKLLLQITDFNIIPAERQYYILALLLLKRLYIYAGMNVHIHTKYLYLYVCMNI